MLEYAVKTFIHAKYILETCQFGLAIILALEELANNMLIYASNLVNINILVNVNGRQASYMLININNSYAEHEGNVLQKYLQHVDKTF